MVDAVDHLLNRGAVVVGDATISLGGVDLVYLGLNVLLSSVETLEAADRLAANAASADASFASPSGKGGPRAGEGVTAPGPVASDALTLTLSQREREQERLHANPLPAGEGTSTPADSARSPSSVELERRLGGEAAPPEGDPARSVAQLVLTLVELLRQVLERQAIRRMEGGSLADDQVERMGAALLDLEAKLAELRRIFNLSEEDLNIDLGPLGNLL